MSRMGRIRRGGRATAVLALAAVLTGCVAATKPGEAIEPTERVNVGESGLPSVGVRSDRPTAPASPTPLGGNGSFSVSVTSPSGSPLPGLRLRYDGPDDGTVVTDAQGTAHATVRPGAYTLRLLECGETLHIVSGFGEADMTVQPRTVTSGAFGDVGTEPRYQPIEQSRTPMPPPWHVGRPFTVQVRIGDMCEAGTPVAKSVAFPEWEIVVEDPMQLARTPNLRSDATGWISVRIVCNGVGDGEIAIRDTRLATRYVSILAGITAPPESYCEQ